MSIKLEHIEVENSIFSHIAFFESDQNSNDLKMFAFNFSSLVFNFSSCVFQNNEGERKVVPKAYIRPIRDYPISYSFEEPGYLLVFRLKPYGFYQLTGKHASDYKRSYLHPLCIMI